MRIDEIKAELESQYPTLRRGSDETGYEELNESEYQLTIQSWAQTLLTKEIAAAEKKAAEEEATIKRQALLDKLGITADEAKLLLG